jgi:hypothetical protein
MNKNLLKNGYTIFVFVFYSKTDTQLYNDYLT